MIIQYKILDMDDNTIVPFTPLWRRKYCGFKKFMNFFSQWNKFPCFSVGGELICHERFGEYCDAKKFLNSISSLKEYYKQLEIRLNKNKECFKETNE